jgi:hypothetical protein
LHLQQGSFFIVGEKEGQDYFDSSIFKQALAPFQFVGV